MTRWDEMMARLIEGTEKITRALAHLVAWAEAKGRYISLMAQRAEKRKELERAYARVGRLMDEREMSEAEGGTPPRTIQEARDAVAAIRKELDALEQGMSVRG